MGYRQPYTLATHSSSCWTFYKSSEVFRRAVDAIEHFGTEQYKSVFAPSEVADIKSVMQSYGKTTEQQKAVGAWLCDYAEHLQSFDEIKHTTYSMRLAMWLRVSMIEKLKEGKEESLSKPHLLVDSVCILISYPPPSCVVF